MTGKNSKGGKKSPRRVEDVDKAKTAAEAAERAKGELSLEGQKTVDQTKPFDLPLIDITDEFKTIWTSRNDYPFIGVLVATRRLLDAGTFVSSGQIKNKNGVLRDQLKLATKEQWELVKASIDANRAAQPVPYEEFLDAVEDLIYALDKVQKRNSWGMDFASIHSQVKDVQNTLGEAKVKVNSGEPVDCRDGVAAARETKSVIFALEITKLENQLVNVGKATNQESMAATVIEQISKIGDVSKRRSNLLGAISQIKSLSHEQVRKSRESVALGELPPVPIQEERRTSYHSSKDRYTGRGTHGREQDGRYAN